MARVAAAVHHLEGEGVAVVPLHLLLGGAIELPLVGAPVVTPTNKKKIDTLYHFREYNMIFDDGQIFVLYFVKVLNYATY